MSSVSVPARTTMYLTKKYPFRVSTNNYCKAATTDNIYTFTIKPDTSLLGDVMYVAYDVRVEGQTVIPRGTQVLVDWVTESTPTIAAQVQVTTIFLDGVAQEISADSPIIEVSTEYNNWEVMNANNMYRLLKYRSTANMMRRLVDNHCLLRVLPDSNLNTAYLEIYTNEIPVFLNENFTPSERPVTVVPEPEVIVRRPIYKIQPRLGRTEESAAISSSIVAQAIEDTQIVSEPEEVSCPGEKKWTYCNDCSTNDTPIEENGSSEDTTTDSINDWIRRNNDIIASVDTMLEDKKSVPATDLSGGKCGCKEIYGSCNCSELDEFGQCICIKTYGKCNCSKKGESKCPNVCNKKDSIKRESVVNQRELLQTQVNIDANTFTPQNQRNRKQWSIPPGVKPESKAAHNNSSRLKKVQPHRRTLPKFRRQ